MSTLIDPDEDFASYYKGGGDPDSSCERLYLWHQALWGREVPGVGRFDLDVTYGRGYEMQLRASDGTRFRLASDGIIPTWSTEGWAKAKNFGPELQAEIAKDSDDFNRVASTIGGYILFPRNRLDQAQSGDSINQARGKNAKICDRFDLTLECIRRHYADSSAENPLGERLAYYGDFFSLFHDFDGYVRFFLLDDLVTEGRSAVRSLMTGQPLRGFSSPPLPVDAKQYAEYRMRSIAFVTARNRRIVQLGLGDAPST